MSSATLSIPSFSMPEQVSQTDIPTTDDVAGLPREERRSAKKAARYFLDEYEQGLQIRRSHSYSWIKVIAIMRGLHYFTLDGGSFRYIPKKKGEIRAAIPLMDPRYRWELGRLNSNQPGVSAVPRLGRGTLAFYKADRSQAILSDWMDEEDYLTTYDTSNQNLLYYGLQAYHWWVDRYHKRVRVTSVPGCELFPIPAGATSWEEMDGIMRVQLVSKPWLERQDERMGPNGKRMASKATEKSLTMSDNFSGMSSRQRFSGSMKGATVFNVWMKDSERDPGGQWFFLVEDELFRAANGLDERGRSKAMPLGGRIPLEPTYYTKKPDDFYGYGFCENLISAQHELNRQVTHLLKWAKENRAFNVFDAGVINLADLQSSESNYVPAALGGFEGGKLPFMHVPAQSLGPEMGAILELVEKFADRAVGYESGILFGRQEGRTESGPATGMLNDNANTPLQPVVDRIFRAHQKMYPIILDGLQEVWPEEKIVTAAGTENMAREMVVKRDDFPTSKDTVLSPTPMVAGGRNAMIQLLFNLRQLPSDDGKGFELKSREFRRALRMMNINPPGLEIADRKEQRILYRISLLINDGQKPAVPDAFSGQFPELQAEDHRLAIEILRDKVLEPGYEMYSREVKAALLGEMEYHMSQIVGPGSQLRHPDTFDEAVDDEVARLGERTLDAQENDLGDFTGQVTFSGIPAGLQE